MLSSDLSTNCCVMLRNRYMRFIHSLSSYYCLLLCMKIVKDNALSLSVVEAKQFGPFVLFEIKHEPSNRKLKRKSDLHPKREVSFFSIKSL